MADLIKYSNDAKAHDLTILKLKSEDLSSYSSEQISAKYLQTFNEIYELLEKARLENRSKVRTRFD